jgi:hypothetical protein
MDRDMINILKEDRLPIEIGDCLIDDTEKIERIALSFGYEKPFVAVQIVDGSGPMRIKTRRDAPLIRVYA